MMFSVLKLIIITSNFLIVQYLSSHHNQIKTFDASIHGHPLFIVFLETCKGNNDPLDWRHSVM